MALHPVPSVTVVEVSKVAPAPPLPPQSSLPFTFYDASWLRYTPSKRLFFYQTSPNHDLNKDQLISRLKQSLSITLRYFYPLAGKLVWPPESDVPETRYLHGDAVSFVIAESSGEEFHRLTGNGFIPAVDYHRFLQELPVTPEEVPVMALQVTFFGEEGFSVGYSINHACLDGKSTAMFMHSWETICREKGGIDATLKPEHTPFYDRTIISDPKNYRKTILDRWLNPDGSKNKSLAMNESSVTPPDLMLGTFLLTRPNIEYLKSSVQENWKETYGKEGISHITSFRVTAAYIWTCLVKSQFTLIDGENSSDKFYLIFPADGRSLVGDPRALNYFGNCIGGGMAKLTLEQIWREDAVVAAAKEIGEAVEGLKESVLLTKAKLGDDFNSPMKTGVLSTIAGSPWFKFYDIDFGWGRPKKVDVVSIDHSRAMSLDDSSDGKGGIQVGIVLEEDSMKKFADLFSSGLEGLNDRKK